MTDHAGHQGVDRLEDGVWLLRVAKHQRQRVNILQRQGRMHVVDLIHGCTFAFALNADAASNSANSSSSISSSDRPFVWMPNRTTTIAPASRTSVVMPNTPPK